MRIVQYNTIMDNDKICQLVREKAVNYDCPDSLNSPAMVNKMMCDIYQLDKRPEEHAYLLCFGLRSRLQGIFEISHGTFNYTLCDPREIFQKALLCNAAMIVIAHNHPSGDPTPSSVDMESYGKLKEVGKMINIPVVDSVIIGDNYRYFSFKESGMQ